MILLFPTPVALILRALIPEMLFPPYYLSFNWLINCVEISFYLEQLKCILNWGESIKDCNIGQNVKNLLIGNALLHRYIYRGRIEGILENIALILNRNLVKYLLLYYDFRYATRYINITNSHAFVEHNYCLNELKNLIVMIA